MNPELILKSDLLDILFENRNKSYGAYVLRREYPKQLLKSYTMIILLVCIAFAFQFFNKHDLQKKVHLFPGIDSAIKIINLPDKETPRPPVRHPSLPAVATIPNPVPHIVQDKLSNNSMPDVSQLENRVIGDSLVSGAPAESGANTNLLQTGSGDVKEPVEEPTTSIIEKPEVNPEFPGGVGGWTRFLQKNLRTPHESDEAYHIKVVVKFVVNEDGSLSDLEIINSGGADFDAEVLRVMKKSPRWIAGSSHGRKVKVYHSQPVIFVNQVDE